VSGGGQDININITSVARKYFKHQRSSQCQISQMTQAVWHLQNVWTKMHTLRRKYFWYLSNVLFAKNKVHTGFLMVLPAVKITISQNQTWTPLQQWSIQTRSWFIYLCNYITYCLDIFYLLCTKPGDPARVVDSFSVRMLKRIAITVSFRGSGTSDIPVTHYECNSAKWPASCL